MPQKPVLVESAPWMVPQHPRECPLVASLAPQTRGWGRTACRFCHGVDHSHTDAACERSYLASSEIMEGLQVPRPADARAADADCNRLEDDIKLRRLQIPVLTSSSPLGFVAGAAGARVHARRVRHHPHGHQARERDADRGPLWPRVPHRRAAAAATAARRAAGGRRRPPTRAVRFTCALSRSIQFCNGGERTGLVRLVSYMFRVSPRRVA